MSALENMVRSILSSLDIDVEAMKADVTKRIADFEQNVNTLNATLITLMKRTDAIETKLDALLLHHGVEIPTATTETQNEPRRIAKTN